VMPHDGGCLTAGVPRTAVKICCIFSHFFTIFLIFLQFFAKFLPIFVFFHSFSQLFSLFPYVYLCCFIEVCH